MPPLRQQVCCQAWLEEAPLPAAPLQELWTLVQRQVRHCPSPLKAAFEDLFFTAFQIQSKVSVRELAEILGLPYNTMFRTVRKLRENLYLTASTVSLEGIVGLDEVYVTAGLKGKRGLKRQPRTRRLRRRGRGS
ncbi:MAG: hypothetical protein AOA66_1729 [Candidatus Bathyarchaeota archaeon BA2]|nr:MAG: hypothetical protein AOA66_1729 [Candidatus Bathyarchaeota archaeon BA2]